MVECFLKPGQRLTLASPPVRFCITGVFNTALHYVVAMGFLLFIMDSPAIANGVAFTVATTFSCVINTLWSFSRRLEGRTLLRFGLVAILGCLMSMAVAELAALAGAPSWFGIGCVVLVVTPTTYLLHRNWTYREAR